jgi:hypothetical protein
MVFDQGKRITCSEFEAALVEYMDGTLPRAVHTSLSRHVMQCPLCHDLLNQVKSSLELCREISAPPSLITKLEERILSSTVPFSSMTCEDFESHLTDYLDGFLPAGLFHRWERHLVTCGNCADLPGIVVRTIGACLSLKADEIPVSYALQKRILNSTSELMPQTKSAIPLRISAKDWIHGLSIPFSFSQLAEVVIMLLMAFFFFSDSISTKGSFAGMYAQSFELAVQTYNESAGIARGETTEEEQRKTEPIQGRYVSEEDR